jgi:hypothetical protein
MSSYQTAFGSLDKYEKGALTIINDDPKNYCLISSRSRASPNLTTRSPSGRISNT